LSFLKGEYMKKLVMGILLFFPSLYADEAQIAATFQSLSKELDDLRASGNNLAGNQESFGAYAALIGFCEKQQPISERGLNKLKQLNFVDENGNMLPNVCSVVKKMLVEMEQENEKEKK